MHGNNKQLTRPGGYEGRKVNHMNKIIKGKRYDTATAEAIHEINTGTGHYDELYKKRTGEFFLAHWTQWDGQTSTIEPLSFETAQKWVAEHMSADAYEEYFGKIDEIGEKMQVCISLDKGLVEKMKRIASDRGVSASDLISQIIKEM